MSADFDDDAALRELIRSAHDAETQRVEIDVAAGLADLAARAQVGAGAPTTQMPLPVTVVGSNVSDSGREPHPLARDAGYWKRRVSAVGTAIGQRWAVTPLPTMNLDDADRQVPESLGDGTLDAGRSRSRRPVRQRAGLAAVAALVAVAAAVTVPYAFTGSKHSPNTVPRVGIGGPKVQATGTAPSPGTVNTPDRPSRVALVSGDTLASVRFPLTPTFTPAGLPAPTVDVQPIGDVRLVYGSTILIASVCTCKEDPEYTDSHPITINGDPATLYIARNLSQGGLFSVEIIWKLHTKWVSVYSEGLSISQVERYTRGLTEHPMSDSGLPITLALVPQGYVISEQEIDPDPTPPAFSFAMAPRAVNDYINDVLKVSSGPELASEAKDGYPGRTRIFATPVQVGNYPGKLCYESVYYGDGVTSYMTLYVLRPGFIYAVSETDKGPLSNADLIRFAAGMSPK
jgi:hypothetical protein